MASITFTSDMEILFGVLREFLEEQRQQRVNVLTGSGGVADGAATVRIANVDGLVKEDDRGIAVPGMRVILDFDVVIDGRWAEFEEQTRQGGAARAAVEPEDDGVVLGIVSRLEEPCQSGLLATNGSKSVGSDRQSGANGSAHSRTNACRWPRHLGSHCTA